MSELGLSIIVPRRNVESHQIGQLNIILLKYMNRSYLNKKMTHILFNNSHSVSTRQGGGATDNVDDGVQVPRCNSRMLPQEDRLNIIHNPITAKPNWRVM